MRNHLHSLLIGSAIVLAPQIASATLLVGFYNNDQVGTADSSKDAGLTGFSGTISGPTMGLLPRSSGSGWNSADGSYGPDTSPGLSGPPTADSGTSFGFGSANASYLQMTVTNSTGQSYTLDRLLFDITRDTNYPSNYGVTYTTSSNPTPVTVVSSGTPIPAGNNATNNSLNWADVASNTLGVVLAAGQSITFKWSTTGGGGIDNVALTAIPETVNFLVLGCLVGCGTMLRSRRRGNTLGLA